jgi:Protein of unknown function (DUF2474)
MASGPASTRPWLHQIGWMALIWAASVAALGVVAFAFRLLMAMAGLTA